MVRGGLWVVVWILEVGVFVVAYLTMGVSWGRHAGVVWVAQKDLRSAHPTIRVTILHILCTDWRLNSDAEEILSGRTIWASLLTTKTGPRTVRSLPPVRFDSILMSPTWRHVTPLSLSHFDFCNARRARSHFSFRRAHFYLVLV